MAGNTIANLLVRLGLDANNYQSGLANAKSDTSKFSQMGSKFFGNLQTAGTVALTAVTGAAAAAGAALTGIAAMGTKWAIDSAPIEGLQKSFDGILDSMDMSGDAMLAAMQKGSQGMIDAEALMMSFNKTAQLTTPTIASRLPDALQYLGKVSASTGADMGYLMDSLVTGVGRLSPKILDNLAINIDLQQAYEDFASSIGTTAGALSKAQQQEAVWNTTLEKLAENTASMPDINGNVATSIAQVKTQWKDLKDQVGVALLPILGSLLGSLSRLGEQVLPVVKGAIEKVVPTIERIADNFGIFINQIIAGRNPIEALKGMINDLFPPETSTRINAVISNVQAFFSAVGTALKPVVDLITENVKLQDVLIAVGIAIMTVLVPALWSAISAVAPVIGAIVAVIAVVALLRKAWESDFLGIRTALTNAWNNTIKPALTQLWQWLSVNVPAAIQTLKDFWTMTLLPAIQAVWSWIQSNLIPLFQTLVGTYINNLKMSLQFLAMVWSTILLPAIMKVWGFIQNYLFPLFEAIGGFIGAAFSLAITVFAGLWENVLQPALQKVWAFMQDNVFPLFQAIGNFISAVFTLGVTVLAGVWQNVLLPAIKAVTGWIKDKTQPIFEAIGTFWSDTLLPLIESVAEWLDDKLSPAFATLGGWIQNINDWLNDLADRLRSLKDKLPDWLTPGSPTPFEIGLWGIGDALKAVNRNGLPALQQNLSVLQPDGLETILNPSVSTPGATASRSGENTRFEELLLMAIERIPTADENARAMRDAVLLRGD